MFRKNLRAKNKILEETVAAYRNATKEYRESIATYAEACEIFKETNEILIHRLDGLHHTLSGILPTNTHGRSIEEIADMVAMYVLTLEERLKNP
jgi:hypothetical protein